MPAAAELLPSIPASSFASCQCLAADPTTRLLCSVLSVQHAPTAIFSPIKPFTVAAKNWAVKGIGIKIEDEVLITETGFEVTLSLAEGIGLAPEKRPGSKVVTALTADHGFHHHFYFLLSCCWGIFTGFCVTKGSQKK